MSVQLVIGASGQVGQHLLAALTNLGHEAVGTCYSHPLPDMRRLDIRSGAEVRSLIAQVRPEVIYLPASLTDVDCCELHPGEGYLTNVIGVRNVVGAANGMEAKLVYFSSDYIFSGDHGPYQEDDPPNPICEYGRQKLIAEHHVAGHSHDYLIVRTTVVYGWEVQGKNFVNRLLNTLAAGQKIKVPNDQVGTPTYAPNLARAAIVLALSEAGGIYNVVGPERTNRYEFACEAARVFGLDLRLIDPVATCELGQAAPRPLNAGMTNEKASRKLAFPLIGYHQGLRALLTGRKAKQ